MTTLRQKLATGRGDWLIWREGVRFVIILIQMTQLVISILFFIIVVWFVPHIVTHIIPMMTTGINISCIIIIMMTSAVSRPSGVVVIATASCCKFLYRSTIFTCRSSCLIPQLLELSVVPLHLVSESLFAKEFLPFMRLAIWIIVVHTVGCWVHFTGSEVKRLELLLACA